MKKKNFILGAGISGLSASYHLNKKGYSSIILEKKNKAGGLLDNFKIKGFIFDHFVHLSLAKDKYVRNFFAKSANYHQHNPTPNNFYKDKWITHSPQNHLYPLGIKEKIKVIKDFIFRKKFKEKNIKNYEQWLRSIYGNYFAENFPMVYTKKYWTITAKQMSSKWVSFRMNIPKLFDIIKGSLFPVYNNTYYAKNLRYPKFGGYKSFLNILLKQNNIKLNQEIEEINIKQKTILIKNKKIVYDNIISSVPLTEICKIIKPIPKKVLLASKKLSYTSGVLVSLGFSKKINTEMWFYIYDKNIKAARVHSPSMKSYNNVPKGCSSLQAEIYLNKDEKINLTKLKKIENSTIKSLIKMKLFKKEDILVKDARYVKFANVLFDKDIYKNRKIVKDYLLKNKIVPIGRFGEWEYLWSDQAFLSGKNAADSLANNL